MPENRVDVPCPRAVCTGTLVAHPQSAGYTCTRCAYRYGQEEADWLVSRAVTVKVSQQFPKTTP